MLDSDGTQGSSLCTWHPGSMITPAEQDAPAATGETPVLEEPTVDLDPMALQHPSLARDDLKILTQMGYKQDLVSQRHCRHSLWSASPGPPIMLCRTSALALERCVPCSLPGARYRFS